MEDGQALMIWLIVGAIAGWLAGIADKGIDDRSNKAATDYNADLGEHPTSDQAADDTNDSRNPGGGKRRGNVAD